MSNPNQPVNGGQPSAYSLATNGALSPAMQSYSPSVFNAGLTLTNPPEVITGKEQVVTYSNVQSGLYPNGLSFGKTQGLVLPNGASIGTPSPYGSAPMTTKPAMIQQAPQPVQLTPMVIPQMMPQVQPIQLAIPPQKMVLSNPVYASSTVPRPEVILPATNSVAYANPTFTQPPPQQPPIVEERVTLLRAGGGTGGGQPADGVYSSTPNGAFNLRAGSGNAPLNNQVFSVNQATPGYVLQSLR